MLGRQSINSLTLHAYTITRVITEVTACLSIVSKGMQKVNRTACWQLSNPFGENITKK